MQLIRSLACAASFVALVAAQSSSLGFTSVPTTAKAGTAVEVKYDAPDLSEPVTITLRKGDADNLDTIATLTSDATNGTYIWTPGNSYENADDYALQIQQGREINYSGAITISGGDAAAISQAQAATSSLSAVGAAITSSYAQSQSVASIQSIINSYSSALMNLTGSPDATTTAAGAGAAGGAMVTGTGTGIARNETMVTPTLTSTSTEMNTVTPPPSTTAAATSSAPSSSSSGAAALAKSEISSPLALVLLAVVGMVF